MKKTEATFGMGCFWKPDVLFSKVPGVLKTEVGYMGGDDSKFNNPSYEEVCSDKTGHVEIVHIYYASEKVSYEKILDVFWKNHNPTQVNRQGPDIGSQYRSVIFFYNDKQKKIAEKSKRKIQDHYKDKKIATEIVPASKFYRAEEYHQKYLIKNQGAVC